MQYKNDQNPYAPPVTDTRPVDADDADAVQLPASRGSRWLARLIDTALSLALYLPVFTYLYMKQMLTAEQMSNSLIVTGLFWAASAPMNLYQWVLISRTGQSLGKKWLGLRVVRMSGQKVGFVEGVVLREWITGVISLIPGVGALINLVGVLMIFGEERRCLHDRFAGTRVVQVLRG